MQNKSFLGIDLGTTTIKISLIDEKNQILLTKDKAHNAQNHCLTNAKWNEQCPKKIVQTFLDLIAPIDLAQLNGIGISGQMHGIVLWKADTINSLEQCKCSKLITWMDGRCDVEFLKKLPKWILKNETTNIEKSISSGYGMATLAWLKENCALDSEWDRAGTIMDFLAAYLTQSNGTILMSDQNAESWGYKDVDNKWTILDHPNEFPLNLLPKIVKVGTIIGHTKIASTAGIPLLDVPILVPIGDLGATLMPILHKGEAALHIGTSAQLAFFLESNQPFLSSPLPSSIVQVPFFDRNSLLVAASLNGGNALDFFLQQIVKWSHQICGHPNKPEEIHYSAILDCIFQQQSNNFASSSLSIKPTFFGERHNPQGGAIVEGWRAENSLEDFICSIARGIVQNLAKMMPEAFLSAHKITKLKLIGKAAGQKIFEEEAKRHFPNLLILNGKEELVSAAFGSALYAKRSLDK